MRTGGLLLLFVVVAMFQAPAQSAAPDILFLHGNIYTGALQTVSAPYVEVTPRVEAMAVREGRIVAAGSDSEISKLKGKRTQTVDLGGRFVMPGFNDAHTHLATGGFGQLNVDLTGTKSLQEMQARIAARVKTAAAGEWIRGRGWDHTLWPGQKLPTREDLDAVTEDHPAIFGRVDGHIAIANSAALRVAGVSRSTRNPPGGQIDRDAGGDATGILREGAMDVVESKEPKAAPSQHRRAMEIALRNAATWGITSAQDFSEWEDFLVCEDMENPGGLTLSLSEWRPFVDPGALVKMHC